MRATGSILQASVLALAALASACGGGPPDRYVLERDVGDWSYRRYQRVLDVELPVEGNPAVGHTATYVQRPGARSRAVLFATVFVTVYERAPGLAEEIRRMVRALGTYEVEIRELGGGRVFHLDAGPGDRWALWVSGPYVVKVGASEAQAEVPEDVVATYMGIYGSDLDEHGRAREGTASAGSIERAEPSPEGEGDERP